MKTVLTKFDDFLEEISASQIFKKVYFQMDNSVQPMEVKDAEGNIKPFERENETGKKEQVNKVVSMFRTTSAGWDAEKNKEDWVGCNIILANEMIAGPENINVLGTKIEAEKNALIKRMKDKLVGNGIILTEGMVTIEG